MGRTPGEHTWPDEQETAVTKRTTPGVVGVLNYLIDAKNRENLDEGMPTMSHGDSVLQCLNILYESEFFRHWRHSDEGQAAHSEAEESAVEQLGLDPEIELTDEQENMVYALTNKLFLQRVPKFDLFSTTEEAVEYWMRRALQLQEESGGQGPASKPIIPGDLNPPGLNQ